jgi:predicted PurR-regulated permease PerM
MFYAMRDRHFVATNVVNAVPEGVREDARNIGRMSDHLVGRYIRAQLLLAVIVGIAIGVGLTLMDVRLSLALAFWAGLTELIPIIGPWLGAIPALIIVAATQPDQFIWVALLYFGVQLAENYLLVPRLQSHAVDIHPAMVVLLLAIAGATAGIIGMLIVVPVAAIVREIFWYLDSRLKGETAEEAYAHSKAGRLQRDRPLDARVDEVPEEQQPPSSDPFADLERPPA